MAIKVFRKRYAINAIFIILIFTASILISGCLQDKQAIEAQDKPQTQTEELIQKAPIEKVSDELNVLNLKSGADSLHNLVIRGLPHCCGIT